MAMRRNWGEFWGLNTKQQWMGDGTKDQMPLYPLLQSLTFVSLVKSFKEWRFFKDVESGSVQSSAQGRERLYSERD